MAWATIIKVQPVVKYQTAKYADGIFTVNCPHCENEVTVDERQLEQINTQLAGRFDCPIEGCGKEIEFPNVEEAAELKVPTSPAAPPPTPAPQESAPKPAPAPPPQLNPAAKSNQPPAKEPTPTPKTTPSQNPSVSPKTLKGAEEGLTFGFHGSQGASLEREAASSHRISMKTILHGNCLIDKKDTFDETVSQFLNEMDEECLIGVHPVQYSVDEKKGIDFGVMILYRKMTDEV